MANAWVLIENPNCDGSGPHLTGEVKVLPVAMGPEGSESNVILCRACFAHEIAWRRERNKTLNKKAQFALPKWEQLKTYKEEPLASLPGN